MDKRIILLSSVLFVSACQTTAQSVRVGHSLQEDQVLADEAYAKGNYVEAERAYKRMTIDNPSEAYNWFKLANVYARTNRPKEAKDAYQESLIRKPENAKAWHNLGVIQLREAALSFVRAKHNAKQGDPIYQHSEQALDVIDNIIDIGEH